MGDRRRSAARRDLHLYHSSPYGIVQAPSAPARHSHIGSTPYPIVTGRSSAMLLPPPPPPPTPHERAPTRVFNQSPGPIVTGRSSAMLLLPLPPPEWAQPRDPDLLSAFHIASPPPPLLPSEAPPSPEDHLFFESTICNREGDHGITDCPLAARVVVESGIDSPPPLNCSICNRRGDHGITDCPYMVLTTELDVFRTPQESIRYDFYYEKSKKWVVHGEGDATANAIHWLFPEAADDAKRLQNEGMNMVRITNLSEDVREPKQLH